MTSVCVSHLNALLMRKRHLMPRRWTTSIAIMVRHFLSITYQLIEFDMLTNFSMFPGNAFVTNFTVGGELYSSRILSQAEQSSVTTTKEKMKAAAALSVSSPWASGGASFAKSNSKEETASEQELHQNLQLAWEARGGNTLLCTKYVPLVYDFVFSSRLTVIDIAPRSGQAL